MAELTGMVGFAPPLAEKTSARWRHIGVELVATAALAISLIIAATAVSIGMARAQALASSVPLAAHDAPALCCAVWHRHC